MQIEEGNIMKVLTIKQSWATLIMQNRKGKLGL